VASVLVTVIAITTVLYFTVYKPNSQNGSRADSAASVFSDIAQRNQAAVALIQLAFEMVDQRGRVVSEGTSEGTGFAIDKRGYIVSNYHTVAPWEYDDDLKEPSWRPRVIRLKVVFADHKMTEGIEAELHNPSKKLDLAILKIIPPPEMPVVEGRQPDLSQIHQGDEVAFIGFPYGTALLVTTQQKRATTTLRRATISKVSENLIQLDASVQQGFSGSPVFDRQGQVIGVLMGEINDGQMSVESGSIALAVPIKSVEALLKQRE
jgi:serine protease Do